MAADPAQTALPFGQMIRPTSLTDPPVVTTSSTTTTLTFPGMGEAAQDHGAHPAVRRKEKAGSDARATSWPTIKPPTAGRDYDIGFSDRFYQGGKFTAYDGGVSRCGAGAWRTGGIWRCGGPEVSRKWPLSRAPLFSIISIMSIRSLYHFPAPLISSRLCLCTAFSRVRGLQNGTAHDQVIGPVGHGPGRGGHPALIVVGSLAGPDPGNNGLDPRAHLLPDGGHFQGRADQPVQAGPGGQSGPEQNRLGYFSLRPEPLPARPGRPRWSGRSPPAG